MRVSIGTSLRSILRYSLLSCVGVRCIRGRRPTSWDPDARLPGFSIPWISCASTDTEAFSSVKPMVDAAGLVEVALPQNSTICGRRSEP